MHVIFEKPSGIFFQSGVFFYFYLIAIKFSNTYSNKTSYMNYSAKVAPFFDGIPILFSLSDFIAIQSVISFAMHTANPKTFQASNAFESIL